MSPTTDSGGRQRRAWRVGTPLVVLLSGSLFVVSALNSGGTDLRPGRYTDLASLVQSESDGYQRLQAEAAELQAEVDDLTAGVDDRQVRRKHRQAEKLKPAAGLSEVSGEGLTIVLSDAPTERIEDAVETGDQDPNLFVVHQQDIQAVVNALWSGGADAVTIQGQRVITTTGIKCTGSAVQLQGIPYPQPYTVQAIGDPYALMAALERSGDVAAFRADAERPEIGVGWSLETTDDIDAPAYTGLLDVDYATPLPS